VPSVSAIVATAASTIRMWTHLPLLDLNGPDSKRSNRGATMGVARPVEFTHFLGAQPYEVWGVSASLRREGALGVAEHPWASLR